MKTKLIKQNCKEMYSGKITNGMVANVEEMFNEFMSDKESKGLENDVNIFFDEMYLDIECELESWD